VKAVEDALHAELEGSYRGALTVGRVYILMVVFVLGFLMLVGLEVLARHWADSLGSERENLLNRQHIGELVVQDITRLEATAYRLTVTLAPAARQRVFEDLEWVAGQLYASLQVLSHGGTLERHTRLNIDGADEMVRRFPYRLPAAGDYALEAIELTPKIQGIIDKGRLLTGQRSASDPTPYQVIQELPPLFSRMREGANRLFYNAQLRLGHIEAMLEKRQRQLNALQLLLTVTIVALVLGLSYRILRSTARANAELLELARQLDDKTEQLGLVIQATDAGIWDWRVQTGEVDFNRRWAEIVGYELHELEPVTIDTWMSLAHPADLAHSERLLNAHWNGETANYTCEARMRHKDGHWVWVLDSGRVVEWDDAGRPLRMIGTHLDVSGRKRMEQSLRDHAKFLNTITDNLAEGILVEGENGHCTYLNPEAERLLGWTQDELSERDIHETIHRHYDERGLVVHSDECELRRRIRLGQSMRSETQHFVARDGRVFPVYLAAVPLVDDDEVSMLVVFQDISVRKEAETMMARAIQDSEEASRAKSAFLANMSHEIRTPMNGVIGMATLLLDSELNPDQREKALTVKRSAESLLGLINDILDFSKIEAGKLEFEEVVFDMEVLLTDFARTFAFRAEEKGLEFICPASSVEPSWFRGDPGRVRQVLTNLVGNAIKFTSAGEVAVYFRLLDVDGMRGRVRFDVRDTGVGIDLVNGPDLFDRFTQADGSTTRQYGGTGLGLAICRQLVEMMHGEIGVDSTPGHGSTFWFTLELEIAEVEQRRPRRVEQLRDQRVLVVDDNATSRGLLDQMLESWGVPHTVVDAGADALLRLNAAARADDPYTLAVIDMQMPGMDGLELGAAIHHNRALAGLQTMLLTSQARQSDRGAMKASGVSAFLGKPVGPSDLYNALVQLAEVPGHQPRDLSHDTAEAVMRFEARVLVVEDNATNQAVATGMLEKLGVTVVCVNNGQQALERLGHGDFDLVFMDCQMPVMDGYEATRRIRDGDSDVRDHAIPVVAMTANAMKGDREKCLAVGMDDYIAKPIDPSRLQNGLKKWLSAASRNQPDDEGPVETAGSECPPGPTDTGSAPIEAPVFDYAALSERLMADEALIHAVLNGFIEDMEEQIASLKSAVSQADASVCVALAHRIKGASANVSGLAMSHHARALELAGKAGRLVEVSQGIPRLERLFNELSEQMKSVL
jgi:PAS domain S-box-containing protein